MKEIQRLTLLAFALFVALAFAGGEREKFRVGYILDPLTAFII